MRPRPLFACRKEILGAPPLMPCTAAASYVSRVVEVVGVSVLRMQTGETSESLHALATSQYLSQVPHLCRRSDGARMHSYFNFPTVTTLPNAPAAAYDKHR